MVTLRTYPNSIEAGMAKSLLEGHNIVCDLADENANVYGGAPFAMPVRLLVDEAQVDEARRILGDAGEKLPDDFDPGQSSAKATGSPNETISSEVLALRQQQQWLSLLLVALLVLTAYLVFELPRGSGPWSNVTRAMHRYDYDMALRLTKAIVRQHPSDYYGHEYLGNIYYAMGDLPNAEIEYQRAYELSPPQVLQEKLRDVRKRRGTEPPPQPTLKPWP